MRIVIVEDEEKIRNGIIRFIHKLSDAYEIVGQCENGLEGMETVKQMNPDLVITDIRMPVMNGIEMLELLKEEGITPKSIILSGHSEFEFARKALHIGSVIEYMLKPITADDLKQVLLKAEMEIANLLTNGIPQSQTHTDREQWIKHILSQSDFDLDRIPLHVTELFGSESAQDCYVASVYIGSPFEEFAAEIRKRLQRALEHDNSTIDFTLLTFPELYEIDILLHRESSGYLIHSLWDHLLEQLRTLPLDDLLITWTIVPHIRQLKDSLHEVRSIRKWSLVLSSCSYFDKQTINAVTGTHFLYPAQMESRLNEAVSSRDQENMKRIVESFVTYCTSRAADPQCVIDACIRFASRMLHVTGVLFGDVILTKEQNDMFHRLSFAQTPNGLRIALLDIAEKIAGTLVQMPKSHSLVINRSVKIIQDRYQTGITLEELADSFNITPEYLSSLFQKELGISFTALIKDIRIKKAKELLIGKQFKSFEVAERVGYSDAKYFSRVFKEVTGTTPGQFQKLHR